MYTNDSQICHFQLIINMHQYELLLFDDNNVTTILYDKTC